MEEIPVIIRSYELYKMIVDINSRLEKRWRYSIGCHLETSVLDLIKQLIMAKNAPKPLKAGYLIEASSHGELAVLELRLFLEQKLVNETKIFQAQAKLADIGRQLGAWLKSINT